MLESTSKISKEVQQRVKEIAAMGGESKKKIDTEAEYKELGKLLAGQTGANAKFVQEKMTEYENFVKEQEEKAFLNKVSDAVKKFVSDVSASFGDEDKIDSDEEASRLRKMLPNTNGDLSKEDIEYIRRALTAGGYDLDTINTYNNEVTKVIKTKEFADTVSNNETKKDKTVEKHKKENPTSKSKTIDPKPAPKPEPKPAEKPKVLERDAIDGTTRGRKFAKEINSHVVNNKELAAQLKGVNSKNAYDFFQQYKSENKAQDIVYRTLVQTSDRKKQLDYRNFIVPIKALLMQAESYGLKDISPYKKLNELFKEITKVTVTPGNDMDPSRGKAVEIDNAINALLVEMGKVVH